MARTLNPKFTEIGRIRIGDQEEVPSRQKPGEVVRRARKLTSFRFTSANKIVLDQLGRLYGGTPERWEDAPTTGQWQLYSASNSLDVIFPSLSAFSVLYEQWGGQLCKLRCDGERITHSASDSPRPGDPCQCPNDEELADRGIPLDTKERCPVVARISVVLIGCESLGVWRLDTHGYYAASEFKGIVAQLRTIPNLEHAPLPCFLRLEERSRVVMNLRSKKPETRKYAVPVLAPKFSYEQLLIAGEQMTPMLLGRGAPEPQTVEEIQDAGAQAAADLYGDDAGDRMRNGHRQATTIVPGDDIPEKQHGGKLYLDQIDAAWRAGGLSPEQIASYWTKTCGFYEVENRTQIKGSLLPKLLDKVRDWLERNGPQKPALDEALVLDPELEDIEITPEPVNTMDSAWRIDLPLACKGVQDRATLDAVWEASQDPTTPDVVGEALVERVQRVAKATEVVAVFDAAVKSAVAAEAGTVSGSV